jgi:D-sedoheptulose 7-phosphate isomerase
MDFIKVYREESDAAFASIMHLIPVFYSMLVDCWENGGTFFTCGNGGSTGIIMNTVTDLNIHPFTTDDKKTTTAKVKRLTAISLSSDHSALTAISNDMGFEHVYSEQLEYLSKSKHDLLFAVSGSGSSANIVKAVNKANDLGMKIVLMTRNPKAELARSVDLHISISSADSKFPGQTGPNNNNFYFEDCICKVSHILVGLLKREVQSI